VPSYMGPFLDDVARWCQKNRWPPLDSLVVNEETWTPGGGYFAHVHAGGLERWKIDVRNCIAFKDFPDTIA
jgi:hypothetical protein